MRKNRENTRETSNIGQQTCVPLALATAFLTLAAVRGKGFCTHLLPKN